MRNERPRRDLLVAGHVNVDRFLRLPRFPARDRTEPVLAERTELGGTATNLAWVAAGLGVSTGLLARIGPEFPEPFRRRLLARRVDLRGLTVVRGQPTPTCTILEDPSGAVRVAIQQGPMGDASRPSLPGAWARQYSWLHVSTGPPEFYLALARWATRQGIKVAVDPAQEIFYRWDQDRFLELLGSAELLFGNRKEIGLAGRFAGGGIRELLARVPLVVRTDGPHGASAFSRAGTFRRPGRTARRVSTLVGAGDSFRGGFYSAWFRGRPLPGCLEEGNRAATRWIEGRR